MRSVERIGAALPGWAWLLLGASATAVFFVGATVHEVVRTPAFYASLSRGIAETGVWFPVMHLGTPYGLKPPLQLWLAAGNIAWLGPTALAVTFWPRLLGLLCALLTADVGRRLYGNAAGFFAGLAMATNVTLIENAHTFRLDAGLLFGMVLALWALVALRGAWRPPVFFGAVSFAVLSKGAPGFLPLFVALAYALWRGRLRSPRDRKARVWLVGALFLLPALFWPLEMTRRFGDDFVGPLSHDYFGLVEVEGAGDWAWQVIRKYLLLPALRWLPFSPFMILGLASTLRADFLSPAPDRRTAVDRALALWVLLALLILLPRLSHRGRYALMFLPPLALLGGRELARFSLGRSPVRIAAALATVAACLMLGQAWLRPSFGWRVGRPDELAVVRGLAEAALPDREAPVLVLVPTKPETDKPGVQSGLRDWVHFHLGRRAEWRTPDELSGREPLVLSHRKQDLEGVAPPLELVARTRVIRALRPAEGAYAGDSPSGPGGARRRGDEALGGGADAGGSAQNL